ncbi:MAG TPA: FAD-dependent oxidoreductase [Caulobacteraceae bacterium]|nr:FAD-dependent oxidoreductase [Caulobacteraceae bacterium]
MFEDLTYEELRRRANAPLPEGAVAKLEAAGQRRRVAAGEAMYRTDDRDYPFVYVISGALEIRDPMGIVLGAMAPGQFTGELALLLGQTSFSDCIITAPGEVLVVGQPQILELVQLDPDIGDRLLEAFAARRLLLIQRQQGTLMLVGPESAPALQRVLVYAERNRIPYRWVDPGNPDERKQLPEAALEGQAAKVVVRGRHVLVEPTVAEVARALGLDLTVAGDELVDLIIAGAGPAGLSAAVYGASEGLTTVLLDDVAIGGQSAASSRIENFLGFPTGVSGLDLAYRAELQAVKFGARVGTPRRAQRLERGSRPGVYEITLDDGGRLRGRVVVIATGARYRRLGVADEERWQGAGLFYAATELEARSCRGKDVVVVGGGNSAGQAAMFLSGRASRVWLVHRGRDLADSMSSYLVERLRHAANVEIEMASQVVELIGDQRLSAVKIQSGDGSVRLREAGGLFVMIGADPCTGWLDGTVSLDPRGFVQTGEACGEAAPQPFNLFQTTLAGVFAVGDVRSGSVKRVASAVGEGSVVVQAVHARLAALREAEGREPVTL